MHDDRIGLLDAPGLTSVVTAEPVLLLRLPDAQGERRIEWFGEPIGSLVPIGELWTSRLHAEGAATAFNWQPLPLHDAAAALLGLWVRERDPIL